MSSSLFDPARYAAVRRPLLQASTLPPDCYTDPDFFRRERERAFLHHWQFVGREEQAAEAGDYFCHDGPNGPVILLRGKDGRLRAFANSCRHRGSRLLSGSGRCKRVVCPYHSWTYQLDGSLAGAPGMDAVSQFERADYPLLQLSLASWEGFVFVHYQASPAPLGEQLGNLPDNFATHRPADMRHVGSLEFEIAANWKLLAENALEAYHTGSVHRDTLGQQQSRPVAARGGWTGLLVEDEHSVATLPGDAKPFPHVDGISSAAAAGTWFTLVYPSTQLVFAQDCLWWLAFQPLAVERTKLTLGACFPQTTIALPGFEEQLAHYFKRWRLATAEDNAICEAQQQGQRIARPPGRFAADEFAPHAFANWVLDQVLD